MYGRVNNIHFDIIANGANLNKVSKQTSVEVEQAKNIY